MVVVDGSDDGNEGSYCTSSMVSRFGLAVRR